MHGEAARQVESVSQIHLEAVHSAQRLLETLSVLDPFRDGDVAAQNRILAAVLTENPDIVNFAVTDTDGIVVASPLVEPGTVLRDRTHVRNALRTQRFSVGEYVLAHADGVPSFPFSVPLRDNAGNVTGTLNVVYNLVSYGELFDRMALPPGIVVEITDHAGTRVFGYPPGPAAVVGSSIQSDAWTAMVYGDETGSFTVTGRDGAPRYFAYRRVHQPGSHEPHLYIAVGIPVSLTVGAARTIMVRNLVLMVLVLVFAVTVAVFLGDIVFARGFRMLTVTAQAISEGHLDARAGTVHRQSEIGRLAAAIDTMAASLQQREQETRRERVLLDQSLLDKEVLLREIHHRVKNNMQMILSIVSLQSLKDADPEEFRQNLEMRISAMATVHEMLYESPDVATINISAFLERLGENTVHTLPCRDTVPRVTINPIETRLSIQQAVPLALITSELITNACKHGAGPGGEVEVAIHLHQADHTLNLTVSDSGPGFDRSRHDESGTGLGLSLVEILTRQIRGEVIYGTEGSPPEEGDRSPGGAAVTIRLPLAAPDEEQHDG